MPPPTLNSEEPHKVHSNGAAHEFSCAAPFCFSRNLSTEIRQTTDTQVSRRPRASNS